MCKFPPIPLICHFELVFGSFCGKMTESGVLDVSCRVTRALPYSMFWADFMHGLFHSTYLRHAFYWGHAVRARLRYAPAYPDTKSTSFGRPWVCETLFYECGCSGEHPYTLDNQRISLVGMFPGASAYHLTV